MKLNRKNRVLLIVLLIGLFYQVAQVYAQQRFPKPEFESGHTQPPTLTPEPRAFALEILDLVVLIGALSLITWLIHKKRSRNGVFWVTIFSIAYFGFFREGCVCSIGAIQNVTLALFQPGYQIPLTVIAFFVTPLVFTLFFGRTFCAGVCPLGAIQDIFIFRPIAMKPWVNSMLGLIPFIYLGLGVLYAATATDFIICRYDPFIGIFRFDGTFMMYMIGGALLLMSIFIARPYCRFFCPYGVLLNWMSRLSRKHMTITPAECIECRLCENSCPFDAIQKPVTVDIIQNKQTTVRRFMILVALIPALVFVGGYAGSRLHENLASVHPKVRLANNLLADNEKISEETEIEITAFRSSGTPQNELFEEAANIVNQFHTGGWVLGGFIGLVFGLTLAGMSRFKYRTDYTPNKGTCLSCGRCMDYCPVKRET